MCLPVCTPHHNTESLFLKVCSSQQCIHKAIALIVALGGVFLLLASYQVLPSFPNVISRSGWWVEAIADAMVVVGGYALFTRNNSQHNEAEFSRKIDEIVEQANRHVAIRDQERTQALASRPTRVSDGAVIDQSHILEYSCLVVTTQANLNRDARVASSRQTHPNHPALSSLPSTDIVLCITNFIKLYENGRYHVNANDLSPSERASYVALEIDQAAALNQKIDRVKADLAKNLAVRYRDPQSPPKEFDAFSSHKEAIEQLSAAWQEAIRQSAQPLP